MARNTDGLNVGKRTCNCCHEELPMSGEYFYSRKTSKNRLSYTCKICTMVLLKLWNKFNRHKKPRKKYPAKEKTPEQIARHKMQQKIWRDSHREYCVAKNKEYWAAHPERHKEVIQHNSREERRKNKNNPRFFLPKRLRLRMYQLLKGHDKSKHTLELLGCDYDFLIKYIESKWADGMNWGNYGRKGWHIDHIRPCASFDLSDINQRMECFNYKNLQPLWAKDNLLKSSIYNGVNYRKCG